MAQRDAILAEGLVKSFGTTRALAGIDLAVAEGTVLGLLGPNGAGKTTAVRILTTLLKPDAGRAVVAGVDVVKHPDEVRARIGLTGQNAAVDEILTGRENLTMFGQLYGLPGAEAKRRADELLEGFDLTDAANRIVKTYSGGMRRRLDLGASLIVAPPVLFLDEPTTGLDPRSRLAMWGVIGGLVQGGTTVLLTTQYLDEADRLANRIVVIDHGQVIAEGTADELKARVGGERLEITLAEGADLNEAARAMAQAAADGGAANPNDDREVRVDAERRRLTAPLPGGAARLPAAVRALDSAGVALVDLSLRRPTLDDVFLSLTGHAAEEESEPDGETAQPGRRGRRGRRAATVAATPAANPAAGEAAGSAKEDAA